VRKPRLCPPGGAGRGVAARIEAAIALPPAAPSPAPKSSPPRDPRRARPPRYCSAMVVEVAEVEAAAAYATPRRRLWRARGVRLNRPKPMLASILEINETVVIFHRDGFRCDPPGDIERASERLFKVCSSLFKHLAGS